MKKTIMMWAAMLAATTGLDAQRGMLDNAVGLRMGLGTGVSFQHFTSNRNAFEAIAYQRFGAANLTLLAQAHEQMFDVRGLRYFYGAGAHVWVFNRNSVLQDNILRENSYALGLDAIVGIAYYLRSFPLQFSVDWKPGINLYGSHYIEWDSGGLSVRYRF
ncbi:MAG: hypothetical protein ACK5BL_01840 [Flavobacteriales bacterium]|jgi:hypothetical protein